MAPHFERFTGLPLRFFATMGIAPFRPTDQPPVTRLRRHLLNAWFVASFVNCALCVLGEIVYMLLTFRRSDFVQTTSLVMCIGFILLCFVKILTIMWQRGQLDQLMAHLHRMCPRTRTECREYAVDAYVAHAGRLMRLYAWIQMAMIWLFNCYPLTTTVSGWWRTGAWELDFPYVIWYPYDPYGRGWFELNFLSQIWAGYFSASGILAADLLLCGVVVQLCMHYDRLRNRLAVYRPDGLRTSKRDYAEMVDCVRTHDTILQLGARLDGIFGVCVLFNLVSSIVIICMLGFLVLTAGLSVALIKYMLTLVTCTLQIFMVCLLGEKCMEASMGIATGAWEGRWYMGDRRYRRGVLMMISRGSRPQCLTAYKFSVASMKMFGSVMSSSWQFFVVLRTAYEE